MNRSTGQNRESGIRIHSQQGSMDKQIVVVDLYNWIVQNNKINYYHIEQYEWIS